jgi:tetratricopeptide (TPR) repeat protein
MRRVLRSVLLSGLLAGGGAFAQEPIPRPPPRAGVIVSARGGEELRIIRDGDWRPAVVTQDVLGGDTLKTGELGTLGVTFADQTTIRLGRQSTLVVNAIAPSAGAGNTELTLSSGAAWARASRGGSGVTVKTPAASAAIRGTDWSLVVQGDRTALTVLEGVVEFTNPQGSVTVRQGEAATARIGEKPTKTIVVTADDREQMMFYVELRDLFRRLDATPLQGGPRQAEIARLAAIPPASRTAEDWLAVVETGLGVLERETVLQALEETRRRVATGGGALRARLDLVEAILAGSQKRYAEAARLFARAARALGGARRERAECGYFAASTLADPKKLRPWPREGDAERSYCAAYVTGFGRSLGEARAILERAAKRHPSDLKIALLSAEVATAMDRRDALRAAVERLRAIDAGSPEALYASGSMKSLIQSDLDGAVRDLREAARLSPGSSEIWNALGLAESARNADLESEAAFRRSIAEDPHNPVPLANLAILLLDQNRVREAGELIDQTVALDPSFGVGYTAKGRQQLQSGDLDKALDSVLAGSAIDPASAQALLARAVVHHHSGDAEAATQALDNADRLDRNDPVTAIGRTAIAIDRRDADTAILSAREAMRRYRNRGGFFDAIAATRAGGSYLGDAYRLLGLDEWARFYTDRVADPFHAVSYFDYSSVRRTRPFLALPTLGQLDSDNADVAGSFAVQGLLLDPLALGGRIGRIDLVRTPFVDFEIGGSAIDRGGRVGWQSEATAQAFVNDPVPTAVSLSVSQTRAADHRGRATGGERSQNANIFVGVAPSAVDRFLSWGVATLVEPDLVTPAIVAADADFRNLRAGQFGAGYSHTFGYRNVMSAAVVATRSELRDRRFAAAASLDPFFGRFPTLLDARVRRKVEADTLTGAATHMIGVDDFTLTSGIEAQTGRSRAAETTTLTAIVPDLGFQATASSTDVDRVHFSAGRLYSFLAFRPNDHFQAEGGLEAIRVDTSVSDGRNAVNPRVGVGVSPFASHWLRAAWRRDREFPQGFSLEPVATLGLVPNSLPLILGGRKETAAFRYDAEWAPNLFTSVEYQRQRASDLRITVPDTIESSDLDKLRVETLSANANVWLTHGLGAFAGFGFSHSRTATAAGRVIDVPYVPKRFGRAGLTFVHPSRIRVSVIENYIGARYDAIGGDGLGAVWTTDLTASFETQDRRFLFSFSALNLFDAQIVQTLATPSAESVPGARRTFAGSVKVRF